MIVAGATASIIVFLSSKRIRRHRPRRNRSSDEAVRASRSYADCARFVHAPSPEIASAVVLRRNSATTGNRLHRCRRRTSR
ncbi:hypothetical protein BRARA_E01489 [Brassica rapa]|uniref:Uncharacterized protein n=1 Tax=Brassica campestris TaxID=3711 RepID=A0A397ZJ30_BRACM|nr:hypothetical protein BRARA_E01489 [Brassica rapa]